MEAKQLRRHLEDFLDEEIRIKTDGERTGHEKLLLESGAIFSEQLLRWYKDQPEEDAEAQAAVLRDLRQTRETVTRNRNGLER